MNISLLFDVVFVAGLLSGAAFVALLSAFQLNSGHMQKP